MGPTVWARVGSVLLVSVMSSCSGIGPQLDIMVDNRSGDDVDVEIVSDEVYTEAVAPSEVVRLTIPEPSEWVLEVNDRVITDSSEFVRSRGPIMRIVVREDGRVDYRQVAEG